MSRETHTALGQGPEFDAIRGMLDGWGPRARGIGDDAAVIATRGDRQLVISTDTSVENVHFRRHWLKPREIGYRAAAAALSDLAAMGAEPMGLLCALAVPESWRRDLDAITEGIGDAAVAAGAPILGGDTSRGGELSITCTVLGSARNPLLRSAARPGESLFVTGRLGGPFAALRALEDGKAPAAPDRERFARPVPRVREGVWLAEQGTHAAIDISDGLAADLSHLAAASGVRIIVNLDRLCIVEGVTKLDAARSGEEYELAVTARADLDVAEFRSRFGIDLSDVGHVEQGDPEVRFVLGGEPVEVPAGYFHFGK